MSELNFTHSNGNKVKLTTPDTLAASKTFKLPNADGSSGQAMVTNGSGALSFASMPSMPVAGITMMDQWSITGDNNKTNGQVIDSNWERSDYFFAQIGTGMSESSGVFTFPQTGIYLLMAQGQMNGGASYAGIALRVSTNSGGSYSPLTEGYQNMSTVGGYHHVTIHGILDVTNASTFRVRLVAVNNSSTQYSGSSNYLRNGITFIRLGDT
tara:strand:+ start:631 stop:1263 length:633 start_codon:yes stop_codon:yes gene_type:complete